MIFSCGMSLWAKDFGLVLDQDLVPSGIGNDTTFDYTGILIPRFSTMLGDNAGLYISAGINYQNNPWTVVPELLRTEFYWRFSNNEFKVGRMQYSDPLGYIANGLFDGVSFSVDTQAGTLSAGAWYTGLLYKKRANISMTQDELQSITDGLDYSDFFNTYAAPKRGIAALNWEQPGIKERVDLYASLLGQFDFSGANLHSQYAVVRAAVPVNDFIFNLGGCLELMENSGDFGFGLAGELGVDWMLPTKIEDRLSLVGRFSSGNFENSSMNAFLPITTVAQGDLFQAKLSGISTITLDYLGRFYRTLSAGISSTYFIRSDLNTCTLIGNDGYFAGNEFYGRLMWSPVSDIMAYLGGGVFLPSLGNAAPNANMQWRVELNVIISLY